MDWSIVPIGIRPTNDLNGVASFTNTATTVAVTFATAETDTSYRVTSLVPTTVSGTPAVGSARVLSIAKTTGGFTATMEAAPGAGNTVNFDWSIQR